MVLRKAAARGNPRSTIAIAEKYEPDLYEVSFVDEVAIEVAG